MVFLALCLTPLGCACGSLLSLCPLKQIFSTVSSFAAPDLFHRAMSLMITDQCCLFLSFEVHLEKRLQKLRKKTHTCYLQIFNKITRQSRIHIWFIVQLRLSSFPAHGYLSRADKPCPMSDRLFSLDKYNHGPHGVFFFVVVVVYGFVY